ncbi:hypothetical protein OEG84_23635 [Hoeflea sp. G2-23]|uniref:Secreted protein n=1 Tax=Hoeflea algicola TaxID=2983763 RepID=A0ABT3ZBX6_9HYPH|nr:hypothetical protein [Hoeflea algicola]MCY0149308.1 hypothetical protein [Hoeflea algicola]MCY0150613.1 hypothetical protein [Hoeflea algicola]
MQFRFFSSSRSSARQLVLCLIALFSVCSTNVGAVEAKDDILQFYSELREMASSQLEYRIEKRSGKWVVKASAWDEYLPIEVDKRNGYIRIVDEGTGGGAEEIQVVLWRLENGDPLVGISQSIFDEGVPATHALLFFRKRKESWLNVTDSVFEPVRPRDFIRVAQTPEDRMSLTTIGARVYYELPKTGTTIGAYLALKTEMINAVCSGSDMIVVPEPAIYQHYCNDLNGRMANAMRFDWNKQDVTFSPGVPVYVEFMPWSMPEEGDGASADLSQNQISWKTNAGKDSRGKKYAYSKITQDDNSFSLRCSQDSDQTHALLIGENIQLLSREDDTEMVLNIVFVSSDRVSPNYPVRMWYFGPDRAWTGQFQPSAAFLKGFAAAGHMMITNQSGQEIASFSARGTSEAKRAMASHCESY